MDLQSVLESFSMKFEKNFETLLTHEKQNAQLLEVQEGNFTSMINSVNDKIQNLLQSMASAQESMKSQENQIENKMSILEKQQRDDSDANLKRDDSIKHLIQHLNELRQQFDMIGATYYKKEETAEMYPTKQELHSNFATKQEIETKYQTKEEIAEGYETKDQIAAKYQAKEDMESYFTKQEIEKSYQTREEIADKYPTKQELLETYPSKKEISEIYVTKQELLDHFRNEISDKLKGLVEHQMYMTDITTEQEKNSLKSFDNLNQKLKEIKKDMSSLGQVLNEFSDSQTSSQHLKNFREQHNEEISKATQKINKLSQEHEETKAIMSKKYTEFEDFMKRMKNEMKEEILGEIDSKIKKTMESQHKIKEQEKEIIILQAEKEKQSLKDKYTCGNDDIEHINKRIEKIQDQIHHISKNLESKVSECSSQSSGNKKSMETLGSRLSDLEVEYKKLSSTSHDRLEEMTKELEAKWSTKYDSLQKIINEQHRELTKRADVTDSSIKKTSTMKSDMEDFVKEYFGKKFTEFDAQKSQELDCRISDLKEMYNGINNGLIELKSSFNKKISNIKLSEGDISKKLQDFEIRTKTLLSHKVSTTDYEEVLKEIGKLKEMFRENKKIGNKNDDIHSDNSKGLDEMEKRMEQSLNEKMLKFSKDIKEKNTEYISSMLRADDIRENMDTKIAEIEMVIKNKIHSLEDIHLRVNEFESEINKLKSSTRSFVKKQAIANAIEQCLSSRKKNKEEITASTLDENKQRIEDVEIQATLERAKDEIITERILQSVNDRFTDLEKKLQNNFFTQKNELSSNIQGLLQSQLKIPSIKNDVMHRVNDIEMKTNTKVDALSEDMKEIRLSIQHSNSLSDKYVTKEKMVSVIEQRLSKYEKNRDDFISQMNVMVETLNDLKGNLELLQGDIAGLKQGLVSEEQIHELNAHVEKRFAQFDDLLKSYVKDMKKLGMANESVFSIWDKHFLSAQKKTEDSVDSLRSEINTLSKNQQEQIGYLKNDFSEHINSLLKLYESANTEKRGIVQNINQIQLWQKTEFAKIQQDIQKIKTHHVINKTVNADPSPLQSPHKK